LYYKIPNSNGSKLYPVDLI